MSEHMVEQRRQLRKAGQQEEVQPDDNGKLLDEVLDRTEQNPSLDDFKPDSLRSKSSFDVSTAAGQTYAWIAENGKHESLEDMADKEFKVRHWITYCKEVIRTDGTIDPAGMVTCLFGDKGDTVSWASPLTNRQWLNVVRRKGMGPYIPPLTIRIVANKSEKKNHNDWYSILPAEEKTE